MKAGLTKDLLLRSGEALRRWLIKDKNPLKAEEAVVSLLSADPQMALVVSGCNRAGIGGENLRVQCAATGPLVAVVTPLDGHVNYQRGSNAFSASVTILNRANGKRAAILYDGRSDRLCLLPRDMRAAIRSNIQLDTGRRVVSIGDVSLITPTICKLIREMSWRSLGSSSLAIFDTAQGHIDFFIARTKIWNFYWSSVVCPNRVIWVGGRMSGCQAHAIDKALWHDYEKSYLFACMSPHFNAQQVSKIFKICWSELSRK